MSVVVPEKPRPKITIMGEEVHFDELPDTGAVELDDHFKDVRISSRAINECSRIVPQKFYEKDGIYTWLHKRANYVFSKLKVGATRGSLRSLSYEFEYDSDGPILRSVRIV